MKKLIIAGCFLFGLHTAFAANENGPVKSTEPQVTNGNFQDSSYQRKKYPDSAGRRSSMGTDSTKWKKNGKMNGMHKSKSMSDSMHKSSMDSTKQ